MPGRSAFPEHTPWRPGARRPEMMHPSITYDYAIDTDLTVYGVRRGVHHLAMRRKSPPGHDGHDGHERRDSDREDAELRELRGGLYHRPELHAPAPQSLELHGA